VRPKGNGVTVNRSLFYLGLPLDVRTPATTDCRCIKQSEDCGPSCAGSSRSPGCFRGAIIRCAAIAFRVAQLDEEELADWRAGRNAVYQLAALTIGARLAVADA
jgi:hypothetical protein